jgi:hypothetical protein
MLRGNKYHANATLSVLPFPFTLPNVRLPISSSQSCTSNGDEYTVNSHLGRVVRARTMSGGEGTLKPGNGGHNSNEALASDLATFVREKQMVVDLCGCQNRIWMGTFLSLCFYIHRPSYVFIARNSCLFPYGGKVLPTRKHVLLCFFFFNFRSIFSFSLYIFSITSVLMTIESTIDGCRFWRPYCKISGLLPRLSRSFP